MASIHLCFSKARKKCVLVCIFMPLGGCFTWVCPHSHLSVYVGTRLSVHLYHWGSKRFTPAEGLQRTSLSSAKVGNRIERRDETEQRGLSPPPDIFLSSFSHHTEEE